MFKVDLTKFKKVASDGDTTTMQHMVHGHKIVVAHKALPKHVQQAFEKLPITSSVEAKGGEIKQSNPKLEQSKLEPPKSTKMAEGGQAPRAFVNGFKDGGKVHVQGCQCEMCMGGKMAQGGTVPEEGSDDDIIAKKQQVDDYNNLHEDEPKEYPQDVTTKMQKTDVTPKQKFADGGDAETPADASSTDNDDAVNVSDDSAPDVQQSDDSNASTLMVEPGQPTPVQNLVQGAGSGTPTIPGGYQQKVAGIQGEAKAEAQKAAVDQATLNAAAKNEQTQLQQYQQKSTDLLNERQGLQQAVQNAQIKPHQLFDNMGTFQRVQTGIGLFLGGIGAGLGHTNNAALDFLNKEIDRDIESQQANLNKKQSLLAANTASLGDLKDATSMTKIMMQDHVASQLAASAAKSNSAVVQQRANQAIGQIKMDQAPLFQQLAMRQSLQDAYANQAQQMNVGSGQQSSSGNLIKEDPASFVPFAPIPIQPDQQPKVAEEIGRAQDTRRMAGSIMNSFEQAAKDFSGIGNKALSVAKTPRSVGALHQALQPTFKDLEGTVRQAAMDNTFANITPNAMDTDADVAQKRQALQQYLLSKQSAPLAKAHGIDLDKFQSTNSTPEARLTPQQQSFLQFARSNPKDPRSPAILKKLGISQ